MEIFILTEEDRAPDGNLTEAAKEKIFSYWDSFFEGKYDINITEIAKMTHIAWHTARRLLKDYEGRRIEYSTSLKNLKLCLIETSLGRTLENVIADRCTFRSDTEKIRSMLSLVKELNETSHAIVPPAKKIIDESLFSMETRIKDLLIERLREKGKLDTFIAQAKSEKANA